MSDKVYVLNIVYAIVDTIVCTLGIVGFSLAAYWFGKWWIMVFNLVPLALFSSHTLLIDSDLKKLEEKRNDQDG